MNSTRGLRVPFRAVLLATAGLASLIVTWHSRPLAPSATTTADVDVVRGCEWLAWLVVGYLESAFVLAALSHLAGSAAAASTSARRLAPRRIRNLVDLAMTAGVAASIVGSAAAAPAVAATPTTAVATHAASGAVPASGTDGLDWPGLRPTGQPRVGHSHAEIGLVSPGRGRADGVVVRPGDTLWTIAARHLPAQATTTEVSAAWHAWYVANRELIGPDPSLIHPGQHLRPPAATTRSVQ